MRQYALITGSYWAFTLTDGALRMLVVLYFHELGYSPLDIALLFLFYEIFGVVLKVLVLKLIQIMMRVQFIFILMVKQCILAPKVTTVWGGMTFLFQKLMNLDSGESLLIWVTP